MSDDNPFDELELDPRLGPQELTEALKRRAERAEGPARQRIQELWRVLTLNERDRVQWAFFAHPRPAESDPRAVDVLREKIPPVISRAKPPALTPTAEDAFVFRPTTERKQQVPTAPPSLYDRSQA